MLDTMRRLLLGYALLAGVVACGEATLDPLPFDLGIQASPVAGAPGDTITFVVTAQGGDLSGVAMDYGDSSGDQYATGGARNARVTFRHAYAARGTFTARATVTDAAAGQKIANIEIRVS